MDYYDFVMQPYETIPRINFGKQRIGLEPSTVGKAFKTKHIKQLYRYTPIYFGLAPPLLESIAFDIFYTEWLLAGGAQVHFVVSLNYC